MKEFVEKINELFIKYDPNTYRMSKVINVDRAIIQRAKSGKRLPTRETVEKICDYMTMTEAEKEGLLKAFDIAKIGEKTYYERLEIKRIIENLAQVCMTDNFFDGEDVLMPKLQVVPNKRSVIGEINVNNMLISLINEEIYASENPKLVISVPFENETLFNVILHRYLGSKKNIIIDHFVHLYAQYDDYSVANNIKTLTGALKFTFGGNGHYRPFYIHTDKSDHSDSLIPFPYFLMTSRWVVQIAGDYKSALLFGDSSMREIVEKHVEILRNNAKILVKAVADNKIFQLYSIFAEKIYSTIEYDPCIAIFLNEEIVENHIKKDIPNRESVVALANQVYIKSGVRHKSFYAKDGLEDFVETGLLSYMWSDVVIPFSIEERIAFLEMIKARIDRFHMLNPFEITCTGNVEFTSCDDGRIFICNLGNHQVKYYVLEEPSICDSFFEFIDSLEGTNLMLKKEKQLVEIERYLRKLRGEDGEGEKNVWSDAGR